MYIFKKKFSIIFLLFISMAMLPACVTIDMGDSGVKKEPTVVILANDAQTMDTPQPTLDTRVLPSDPEYIEGEVEDVNSSRSAGDKRVLSGDSYLANFFERPFTADEMRYLPEVDIQYGYISSDDNYYIFTIVLSGVNRDSKTLVGNYGVELDIDVDGRGDYSIWVKDPVVSAWTSENVRVFRDSNNDIGGKDAYTSDAPSQGDGYDQELPNTNVEAAFARIVPDYPAIVQIAVHKKMVDYPLEFLWGVWADAGLQDPRQFDYDDRYTYRQAGSPIYGNKYYPLATVHSCDNTCRRPYGFYPTYRIPNMCWSGGPALTPTPGTRDFELPDLLR